MHIATACGAAAQVLRRSRIVFLALLMALALASVAVAGHGDPAPAKKGILLVAFGSSVPEAQVSFTNMENKVRVAYPDVPVRWAFTSNIIREKLLRTEGRQTDSLPLALAKMQEEGFTHVAVQSLHSIPGEEFHRKLLRVVDSFRSIPGGLRVLEVGMPLMAADADIRATADAALASAPRLAEGEALVLMGHGTHHPGNVYYPALQHYLSAKSDKAFVGTVEGAPALDEIVAVLKARKFTKVCLMPFMSVAGDHARNDMAGPEEDSWKSVLEAEGFITRSILTGTAQLDPYVAIWMDHLADAYTRLDH